MFLNTFFFRKPLRKPLHRKRVNSPIVRCFFILIFAVQTATSRDI